MIIPHILTAAASPGSNVAAIAARNEAEMQSFQQRLESYHNIVVTWLRGNALELLIAMGVGVLVFLILSWVKRRAAKIARESEQRAELKSIIARTIARTSKFFRIMVAMELVNGYANAPAAISNTIHVLFTIAAVLQVAIWAREIILGFIERRAGESMQESDTLASAMTLIRLLVSFAVFAIATIVILDNLGVNVTGLVAGLGVGGIAIGLAAQGIFSDLFAAISIIFDKPFRRGDLVTYDQTTARVEKIGMKSTRLRALTGEEKIISNSKLLEKEITNGTLLHYRRTTHVLGFIYQTPPEKLRALPDLMQKVVEDHHSEFVRCVFTAFNASSIDMQLVFDTRSPELEDIFHARHEIGLSVFEVLLKEGYDFAYPTQTTFTAAPDGEMVLPYAEPKPAVASPRKTAKKA